MISFLARHFSATEVVNLPGPGLEALYWCFRRTQGYVAWRELGGFITRFDPPLDPSARSPPQTLGAERVAFAGVSGSERWDRSLPSSQI